MAPGVCGFRRRNFWLEFEKSNPEGLRSTLFPGGLWSLPGKSRGLRAPLVLAERQPGPSPPGPSVFSFVLQIFSGRGEPWRKRSHSAEDAPAYSGLQTQGSRGSEGDRGRWASGEKAEERLRGSPGRRASCVHPLGACARFLAPRAPPKVAVPSRFAQASGY